MEDTLEIEGQEPITSPSAANVEQALDSLSMTGPSYCILTSAKGSYIQTAGTKVGLLVEFRHVQGKSFQHYVFGHRNGDRTPTSVRYKHGTLQLMRNEVLLVNEAREIFVTFLAVGQIADGWNLRDITDSFE